MHALLRASWGFESFLIFFECYYYFFLRGEGVFAVLPSAAWGGRAGVWGWASCMLVLFCIIYRTRAIDNRR